MAAGVKVRSREAVRHFPQGFRREGSHGEDEWGVLWAAGLSGVLGVVVVLLPDDRGGVEEL
jgi:hypothetical protein